VGEGAVSDARLCTLCGQLVDLEAEGVKVIEPRRGGNGKKTTVVDAENRVHIVTTRKLTEKHQKEKSGT
jgi:hypothetical protein